MKKTKAEQTFLVLLLAQKEHSKDFYTGLRAAWYFSGTINYEEAKQMAETIDEAFQD